MEVEWATIIGICVSQHVRVILFPSSNPSNSTICVHQVLFSLFFYIEFSIFIHPCSHFYLVNTLTLQIFLGTHIAKTIMPL